MTIHLSTDVRRRWRVCLQAALLACVMPACLVLAGCASTPDAAGAASFEPLEPASPGGTAWRLGTEAELAAASDWQALEAQTARLADLRRGAFTGTGGLKIHYRLYQHRDERHGAVVIVSGRTEGLAMYQETVLDLVRNGYSVYLHDHRGQGFSQRLLAADPTMGHVDSFENYVQDLAAFIAGPVRQARASASGSAAGSPRPMFLLAHSMGGAVAALYLQGVAGPPDAAVRAAALITPMMEPWPAGEGSPGFASQLADGYCDIASVELPRLPGVSERYSTGGPFDAQYEAYRAADPAIDNGMTGSAVRYGRHWQTRRLARCTGDDCGAPDARIGGPSFRWFAQACRAAGRARGPDAARIGVPVLLLQGGADRVVKPAAQKAFCDRLADAASAGYCVGRTLPQARHALLIEQDDLRHAALAQVLAFYDCAAAGNGRCR